MMKRMILLLLLIGCAQPVVKQMPQVQEVPVIAEVPEQPVMESAPEVEPVMESVSEVEPVEEVKTEPVPETKVEVTQAATHKIDIVDYEFSKPVITIKSGDTIEWVQKGQNPHTVTSTEGPEKFDSGIMRKKDEIFSYTFTRKGTYRYKCAIHPVMRGTVIVE